MPYDNVVLVHDLAESLLNVQNAERRLIPLLGSTYHAYLEPNMVEEQNEEHKQLPQRILQCAMRAMVVFGLTSKS